MSNYNWQRGMGIEVLGPWNESGFRCGVHLSANLRREEIVCFYPDVFTEGKSYPVCVVEETPNSPFSSFEDLQRIAAQGWGQMQDAGGFEARKASGEWDIYYRGYRLVRV